MKALLLLAVGGPRSLEEVEFLLTCLFGRKPSPKLLERVKERYRLIGGCSPLPAITERQAKALEEKLNSRGYLFKSYVGMRYSQPLVEETLKEILQDGVKEVVAIPMAPFRSRFSTGAYKEELNRANKISGEKLKITFIEGWHVHPLFLQEVAERVEEELKQFTPLEIMPRCSVVPPLAGLDFRIIPGGSNAPDRREPLGRTTGISNGVHFFFDSCLIASSRRLFANSNSSSVNSRLCAPFPFLTNWSGLGVCRNCHNKDPSPTFYYVTCFEKIGCKITK